jgi:hypothetical protein
MGKQTHNGESDRVDAAFNRVLAAEAKAREEVEACRRQAAAILAGSQARADQITSRAEHRILRAHRIADAGVQRALAALLTAGLEPAPEDPTAEDLARLDRVLEALVEEILAPRSGQENGP